MKTKTPEQEFIETVQGAIATLERDLMSRKAKRIVLDKKAAAQIVITFRPFSKAK
jgi:hypothetical protein